ncbi:hypothetical protein [Bythopirellula polymerisocia]|uniref:Uncharacterized protein n=1 Tax=Bythopirellula polymerisocia TaxID=2528003 RepID=A0A5C6D0Q1_9BACT|nr:hypothetical protein [Bythopirellula polymerisocia]TWU30450.1 hypothetical protein Pla144_12370 [Bythopirellula polymerisocia]
MQFTITILRYFSVCFTALTLLLANRACAEVAIDVEVAMQKGVPITAPQEWAKRLGKLGLARVQIRSAEGQEQPEATLNETGTRVSVLAVLTSRDELIVPQHKFRAGDVAKLRAYFEGLPHELAEAGIDRGPFRLTEPEFGTVFADLEKPLSISTKGKDAAAVLAHCERGFHLPVSHDPKAGPLLATAPQLTMELEGISTGTALVIALRSAGLTIRPVNEPPGDLHLVVAPYTRNAEVWPIGWKPEGSPRALSPQMFDALSIEIEGYTLATALTALGPRMQIPVVMDEWILDRLEIRPTEIPVKLAKKKTTLMSAVDRMLSQARLAGEIRTDDSGAPFLWVTQYGPDSRPAKQ